MSGHSPSHAASHEEDLAFIERIIEGDEEACRQFSEKYHEHFVFLARRNHVPLQDCDDVAQDALVNALQQIQKGNYRGISSLGTWLEYIIRGAIANYFRNLKRALPVKTDKDGNPVEVDELTVNERRSRNEEIVSVHEVLPRLSSMHHIILVMKMYQGWTIHEIGQKLGMTDGQVAHKLYAAQEQFRHHLEALHAERQKAKKKLPPSNEGGSDE